MIIDLENIEMTATEARELLKDVWDVCGIGSLKTKVMKIHSAREIQYALNNEYKNTRKILSYVNTIYEQAEKVEKEAGEMMLQVSEIIKNKIPVEQES